MMSRLIERCDVEPKMLEVQYRMHPAICAWVSKTSYGGRLVSDKSLYTRPSVLVDTQVCALLRSPCVFVDVADGVERGKLNHDTSYQNEQEVVCTVQLVTHLLSRGVSAHSIGVISFYKSQVVAIRKKLSDDLVLTYPQVKDVKVSTVDGFQGLERDIIILSTVRTCVSAGFLSDKRRTNVAMSRAKHHLYVLGNKSVLECSNTDFSSIIAHYESEENPDCIVVTNTVLTEAMNEIGNVQVVEPTEETFLPL